jgi:hypothetical protein
MSAPTISIQLIKSGDNLCPHGVKMEISYEGQEVSLLVAQDGFVAILEKVP